MSHKLTNEMNVSQVNQWNECPTQVNQWNECPTSKLMKWMSHTS